MESATPPAPPFPNPLGPDSLILAGRRPGLVGAWVAGFALYQWLFPTGPEWWTNVVAELDPPAWGIGATVPSFLASFGITGEHQGAATFEATFESAGTVAFTAAT